MSEFIPEVQAIPSKIKIIIPTMDQNIQIQNIAALAEAHLTMTRLQARLLWTVIGKELDLA